MKRSLFTLLLCCAWLSTAAAQIILNGNLLTDDEQPVPATRVGIAGGEGDITGSKGQFSIKLSWDFIEGERVILTVAKKDWVINYPLDGEWNLPNIKLQKVQYTKVIIVPKGSKALWTHARIEKHIAMLSDELAKTSNIGGAYVGKTYVGETYVGDIGEAVTENNKPKPIDFSYYLSEWANKYGFTPDQVKVAFDQWANEVEDSKDYRTQGLRDFYEKNFAAAADNFEKAARQSQQKLKNLQEEERRQTLQTYENWKLAGNSLSNLYQFEAALAKYDSASQLVPKETFANTWAEIRNLIGNAKVEIGIRGEGERTNLFLREAEEEYHAALTVRTREQLPQQWASTQNNLGNALYVQGIRRAGEEGAKLLSQAVEAFRAALTVRTREQLPQDWANTQNNLANALQDQGIRVAGEEGRKLLVQAVEAYRAALTVRTREQLPQDWAETQNNLGIALHEQGTRTAGEEGAKLLSQAVEAFHAALMIYTRAQMSQDWANTQNNLGNALKDQGIRRAGEEGAKLLSQAVETLRAALTVYNTREQLPQGWAMTQKNLGTALFEQGIRTVGEERTKLFTQAIDAFRNALQVYTREQLPQQWADTQNNLGAALSMEGLNTRGEERAKLLAEAVSAFRAVLSIYTQEHSPQQWATTQINLGLALQQQGLQTAGEDGVKLLAEAVDAYHEALKVNAREQLPQDWATTQDNLGVALLYQGIRTAGEAGAQLSAQAVEAFRNALQVRTREHLSQQWAQTQNNLGVALRHLGTRLGGEEGMHLLHGAVAAYQSALQMRTFQTLPRQWAQTHNDLVYLYHEVLFDFSDAFTLNQEWLTNLPNDLSAQCDFAEKHFTTGRFVECEKRIAALLVNPQIESDTKIALRVIEIANLLALGRVEQIPAKLYILYAAIASQSDSFKVGWTFNGTKHFISQNKKLASYRPWLLQLFEALEIEEGREAILAALREARASFQKVGKKD